MDSTANFGTMHRDSQIPFQRADADLKIHRLLPIAACYFFLNAAGLPTGVFYTSLLSPLIYLWLYLKGHRWLTAKFLLILSPFILAHMLLGVASPYYYFRSLFLIWTVAIAVYALAWAITNSVRIGSLFDQLILLNFGATLFAIAIRPTPLRTVLWHDDTNVLVGTSHLLRLNLLSTEPSAYANLMLPLLIFAGLRAISDGKLRNVAYLMMIVVPFLLAQSFGGLSMALAGIGVSLIATHRKQLLRPKFLIPIVALAILGGVLLLFPNPISQRALQIATGGDASTKSRTTLSFALAYIIASSKSLIWGAGLGQAKLADVADLGLGFAVGIIPNAVAGTFAEFGLVGVLIRFTLEFYFFFKTRTYRDTFRFAMFVVALITQITGSYVTDVQEYLMWFLAFFPLFPDLTLRNHSKAGDPR